MRDTAYSLLVLYLGEYPNTKCRPHTICRPFFNPFMNFMETTQCYTKDTQSYTKATQKLHKATQIYSKLQQVMRQNHSKSSRISCFYMLIASQQTGERLLAGNEATYHHRLIYQSCLRILLSLLNGTCINFRNCMCVVSLYIVWCQCFIQCVYSACNLKTQSEYITNLLQSSLKHVEGLCSIQHASLLCCSAMGPSQF